MLAGRTAKGKKSNVVSLNAVKCPELGQLLYDYFIDCLQIYARTSQQLLMREAQNLHKRLLEQGYEPHKMPNLENEAGRSWFRRWRIKFDIVSRKTVKHLKVSRKKLKQRVGVYLKNVFVLKFLWDHCFPEGRNMR